MKKYKLVSRKHFFTLTFLLICIFFPIKASAATQVSTSDINSSFFYFDATGKTLTGEFPKNGTKISFQGQPVLNQQRKYTATAGIDNFCKGNTSDSRFQVLAGDAGIPGIVVKFTSLSPVTAQITDIGLWGIDPVNGCIQTVITQPMILNDKSRQQTASFDASKTDASNNTSVNKQVIDAIKNTDIKFKDGANIIVKISGKDYTYYDSNPTDTKFIFVNNSNGCTNQISFAKDTDFSATKLTANADIKYQESAVKPCADAKRSITEIPNTDKIALRIFEWDDIKLKSLGDDPLKLLQLSDTDSLHFVKDPNKVNQCGGGWEVILDSPGGNTGTLYEFNNDTVLSECVKSASQKRSVLIDGAFNTPAAGAATGSDPTACETGYKGAAYEFGWFFCPILRGIDGIIGETYNLIESQLFICTGESSTTGETCSGNLLTDKVKNLWSVFRNLTSGLLVIILLIMVLSQSFGGGVLDAYTFKKMFPRLVIAAIAMQISWYLLKYFVDLSNDLGRGIGNLMYYPFGGPGEFDLDNLLGAAGAWAPGVTITSAGLTVGALVAFAGFTPFGFLLLGLGAIVSLLIGVFVLIFRQILIIMCLILAPLALLAWILPGTQKYFKLWQDNFTKLLLMFPMIIAMIAAGRIFAHISSQGAGGFIGMLVILVGVFGPLFFLPKTFKWGGSAFSALANGIWKGSEKVRGWAPGKANEAFKTNREQRAGDRKARIAEGVGSGARPYFDRALSGKYNFALNHHAREHAYQHNRAAGRKAAEESASESIVGSKYESMTHPEKVKTLTELAQGKFDGESGINAENNPVIQRWALDELAKFGDWKEISNLRAMGPDAISKETWEKFVAKNIGAIHQNMPHLSPQRKDLTMQGYEDFASWKDAALAEYRQQVARGYVRDNDGGEAELAPADRHEQLERAYIATSKALGDEQVLRRMSAGGISELREINRLAQEELLATQTTARPHFNPRKPDEITRVDLPQDMNKVEAQNSVTKLLVDSQSDSNSYAAVQESLVSKAASTRAGSPEETQLFDYMKSLHAKNTPLALKLYDDLKRTYVKELDKKTNEAEGASLSVGDKSTEIVATIDHTDNEVNQKKSNILSELP